MVPMTFKILIIDESDAVAHTIASMVDRPSCEIISCHDMALAEAATDLTEFDLILVAPDSTGVNGLEGLAVADFLALRNPRAVTVLMLGDEDGDLKAIAQRNGSASILTKPLCVDEFRDLSSTLGIRLARPPAMPAVHA